MQSNTLIKGFIYISVANVMQQSLSDIIIYKFHSLYPNCLNIKYSKQSSLNCSIFEAFKCSLKFFSELDIFSIAWSD